jgi:outer membrane lipoprotein-sorting protein
MTSKKNQAPSSKSRETTAGHGGTLKALSTESFRFSRRPPLPLGSWSFSGCWMSLLGALILLLPCFSTQAEDAPLDRWLAAQSKIQTWSADVVQTRTLKSFAQPLQSNGRVWFRAPTEFHWELGNPATTIAVRQTNQMLVIYPKFRRVEKYPLDPAKIGAWKDALALLEAGFPRNKAEMEERFQIVNVAPAGEVTEVTLDPKSSAARRMLQQLKIGFDNKDLALTFTELKFADGSVIRNDFKNPKINEPVDAKLFAPDIPADYKVSEPLKGGTK